MTPPGGFRQRAAATFSAALLALVLSPIAENVKTEAADGFPLSHYPMFTADRGAGERVTYLVGVAADGTERRLPYGLAGSGGLNQTRKQITSYVGDGRAQELCDMVAKRASERASRRYRDLRGVRIVSGTYDLRGYFAGQTTPVRTVEHSSCQVPEREP